MRRWQRPDLMQDYRSECDFERLLLLRQEREALLLTEHWRLVRELFNALAVPPKDSIQVEIADLIRIGAQGDLSLEQSEVVRRLIKALIPWRKGPFSFFGETIDAEWRSEKKWQRIAPHLQEIKGKRVLDIGCNNGYYMARALELQPRFVYGIDPSERTWYQFELLQVFLQESRLAYDLLGIEHLDLFPGFFDTVLCMGILYHHRNPYQMLMDVRRTLRVGGLAIIESIVVPGVEPTAICVPERYAMMRNVYFIPTVSALEVWIRRAGFIDVELIEVTDMLPDEQRRTDYAPFQSLDDFLDANDRAKTVEGFPAPQRACFRAIRRKD